MGKVYRVSFFDTSGYNQKLLEADCEQDVHEYMDFLGCTIDHIEEVKQK